MSICNAGLLVILFCVCSGFKDECFFFLKKLIVCIHIVSAISPHAPPLAFVL